MKKFPLSLLVLCLAGKLAAQRQLFFPGYTFPAGADISLFDRKADQSVITLNVGPEKHVAFFCKMEDKLYSKLNIWIKFRAGSDEIYRRQLEYCSKN